MNMLYKAAGAALMFAALGGCTNMAQNPNTNAAGMPGRHMMGPGSPMMGPGSSGVDTHMRQMQEMHTRMMAATTPEQRQALRAEHYKAMHGGMAAMYGEMGTMQQAGHCTPEMMQRHRNMMQMMMQMMEETPADASVEKK